MTDFEYLLEELIDDVLDEGFYIDENETNIGRGLITVKKGRGVSERSLDNIISDLLQQTGKGMQYGFWHEDNGDITIEARSM